MHSDRKTEWEFCSCNQNLERLLLKHGSSITFVFLNSQNIQEYENRQQGYSTKL
jgi:hypothetical protein